MECRLPSDQGRRVIIPGNPEGPAGIRAIALQFGEVIEGQIQESFGDVMYARALEELGVMREELEGLEEPEVWNHFLKDLKRKLLGEELGGDRRDMWMEIRKHKVGLLTKSESATSTVDDQEAQSVSPRSLIHPNCEE